MLSIPLSRLDTLCSSSFPRACMHLDDTEYARTHKQATVQPYLLTVRVLLTQMIDLQLVSGDPVKSFKGYTCRRRRGERETEKL